MSHVVAEPCFDCKYTNCVVVCPVECFYQGEQMLYIQGSLAETVGKKGVREASWNDHW